MQVRCIVCDEPISEQGLEILGNWICSSCEESIVKISIHDARYVEYGQRLKVIWQGIL